MIYRIKQNQLTFQSMIGNGAFKTVYKGVWRGLPVAISTLKERSDRIISRLDNEVAVGCTIDHPNLIRVLGVGVPPDVPSLCVVSELVDSGTLHHLLHEERRQIDQTGKIRLIRGLLSALEYLHSISVAHRDVKSENVLVTGNLVPRLTDFGFCFQGEREENGTTADFSQSVVGTVMYMPPELMRGEQYNPYRADIYSTGLVIFEIMAEQLPYDDKLPQGELVYEIAHRGVRPRVSTLSTEFPAAWLSVVECMLGPSEQRPQASEVLESLVETLELPVCPNSARSSHSTLPRPNTTPEQRPETLACIPQSDSNLLPPCVIDDSSPELDEQPPLQLQLPHSSTECCTSARLSSCDQPGANSPPSLSPLCHHTPNTSPCIDRGQTPSGIRPTPLTTPGHGGDMQWEGDHVVMSTEAAHILRQSLAEAI